MALNIANQQPLKPLWLSTEKCNYLPVNPGTVAGVSTTTG